jgi:hypothetical protein
MAVDFRAYASASIHGIGISNPFTFTRAQNCFGGAEGDRTPDLMTARSNQAKFSNYTNQIGCNQHGFSRVSRFITLPHLIM